MRWHSTVCTLVLVCVAMLGLSAAPANALGGFSPWMGNWRMDSVDGESVLVIDGSRHTYFSSGKFPIAVHAATENFQEGSITVLFNPVAGKADEAGGIFFDRKINGDYLVLRANALENNLNLYTIVAGKRSLLKQVDKVSTLAGAWHELQLTIAGGQVQGSMDGKLLLEYDLGRTVSGGVGVWSKDDSVTLFKNFHVVSGQH